MTLLTCQIIFFSAETEYVVISQQLRRFAEFHQMNMECSIFPAVQDLLANLVLPPEGPLGGPINQQMQISQVCFSFCGLFYLKHCENCMTNY